MLWTSIYVLPGLPSCFSSLGFRVAWPSCAQRWIFLLKPCWARRLDFFRAEIFNFECSVQKFSYFGVLCKNIGQVSLHVTRPSRLTIWIWPMSLECFLKPWKMRQNNELHADLASFLFNCARKNAFWGVRAEILLFLGFVKKYYFFGGSCRSITVPSYCTSKVLFRALFRGCAEMLVWGEIFTSAHWTSPFL